MTWDGEEWNPTLSKFNIVGGVWVIPISEEIATLSPLIAGSVAVPTPPGTATRRTKDHAVFTARKTTLYGVWTVLVGNKSKK